MQALEWALLGGEDDYVESAVAIGEIKEPLICYYSLFKNLSTFAFVLRLSFTSLKKRSLIILGCGAAHTAWQIAISETQRQAIYADPKWNDGDVDMR